MSAVSKAEACALPVGLVYPAKLRSDAKKQAKRELNKAIATAVWNTVVDRDQPTVETFWPEGSNWVDIPITEFMSVETDAQALDVLNADDVKGGV